ncbi:MAG: restriction endonuclease [Sporichthyaceae bacterium]
MAHCDEVGWQTQLLGALAELPADAFQELLRTLLDRSGFVDVAVTTRGSGEGLEGVGIYRTDLVSFAVVLQCRRIPDAVGPAAVRELRDAMAGRGDRGLLIGTGTFTDEARAEAQRADGASVDLLDGARLCDLLRTYGLGVRTTRVEQVAVDEGFFGMLRGRRMAEPAAGPEELRAAVQGANALTRRWIVDAAASERSTVLCGPGAWMCLAYLAAAATGRGEQELGAAVGLTDVAAVRGAAALEAAFCEGSSTRLAHGVWAEPGFVLDPWWRRHVGTAQVRSLPEDRAVLDAWVAEATGGLIERVPLDFDRPSGVLLLSATAVETSWTTPFEPDDLRSSHEGWQGRRIAGLTRSTEDLDDVSVVGEDDAAVTVLRVEGSGDVDVFVAMGHETAHAVHVLTTVVDLVTGQHRYRGGSELSPGAAGPGVEFGLVHHGSEPVLTTRLPRFELADEHYLTGSPAVFGLGSVTDPSVHHFPKLSPTRLAVGQARQAAVAAFTETGFRAASATAVEMMITGFMSPYFDPRSISLRIDRPFGFLAVRRDLGAILCAGWVADVQDAPLPTYDFGSYDDVE